MSNKANKKSDEIWQIINFCNGFDQPHRNYYWVPKQLDYLMSILTGAELKILLYIVRHTWGYNKIDDIISYSQFSKGITSRQGDIVDYGTGLSISQIKIALKGLEKYGLIEKDFEKGRACSWRLRYKDTQPKMSYPQSENELTPSVKISPTIEDYNTKYTIRGKKNLKRTKGLLREVRKELSEKLGWSK